MWRLNWKKLYVQKSTYSAWNLKKSIWMFFLTIPGKWATLCETACSNCISRYQSISSSQSSAPLFYCQWLVVNIVRTIWVHLTLPQVGIFICVRESYLESTHFPLWYTNQVLTDENRCLLCCRCLYFKEKISVLAQIRT